MSLSDLLLLSRRNLLRTLVLAALALAACLWVSFHFLERLRHAGSFSPPVLSRVCITSRHNDTNRRSPAKA